MCLIKDNLTGRVHLVAREFLGASDSGLYLLPVGLFRMTSRRQNEDWSIDPWVLLELFERWGSEKSRRIVRRIWDLMEIPLKEENIGRKTVVVVSLDGIEVEVRNP